MLNSQTPIMMPKEPKTSVALPKKKKDKTKREKALSDLDKFFKSETPEKKKVKFKGKH